MIECKAIVLSTGFASGRPFYLSDFETSGTGYVGLENTYHQYERAKSRAIEQYKELKQRNPAEHNFIDAHLLLLQDRSLDKKVYRYLEEHKVGAKEAFKVIMQEYIDMISHAKDPYLKERYVDFLDIMNRVLSCFDHRSISLERITDSILICEELFPSFLIKIDKTLKGIVVQRGSYQSHSAIKCRELGIPYVIVPNILQLEFKHLTINTEEEKVILDDLLEETELETMIPYFQTWTQDISVFATASHEMDIILFNTLGIKELWYSMDGYTKDASFLMEEEKQFCFYSHIIKMFSGSVVGFRLFQKSISNRSYYSMIAIQIKAILRAFSLHGKEGKILIPAVEYFREQIEIINLINRVQKEHYSAKNVQVVLLLETQKAIEQFETFQGFDEISLNVSSIAKELFNHNANEILLDKELYRAFLSSLRKAIDRVDRSIFTLSVFNNFLNQEELKKLAIDVLGVEWEQVILMSRNRGE